MIKTNKMLRERIKDLEGSIEFSRGLNDALARQVLSLTREKEVLLDKIFAITGLNSYSSTTPRLHAAPPQQVTKAANWKKMRVDLEDKARRDYWENKKREQEQKKDPIVDEIDEMLKQVESNG